MICIISSLSQLTKILSWLWLTGDVSKYIKLVPIGGKLVAPLAPVGLVVFVERIKFCNLTLLFML